MLSTLFLAGALLALPDGGVQVDVPYSCPSLECDLEAEGIFIMPGSHMSEEDENEFYVLFFLPSDSSSVAGRFSECMEIRNVSRENSAIRIQMDTEDARSCDEKGLLIRSGIPSWLVSLMYRGDFPVLFLIVSPKEGFVIAVPKSGGKRKVVEKIAIMLKDAKVRTLNGTR